MVKYRAKWKIEAMTKKGNFKKGRKVPRIFKPEGRLSDDDWIALERIADILASFESVVQVLEEDGQRRCRKHGLRDHTATLGKCSWVSNTSLVSLRRLRRRCETFLIWTISGSV
jgi:hypothetical protein